jgi:dihydroxyacetone kinase
MGGTLGAIFGIFLSALASSIRSLKSSPTSTSLYASAVSQATASLMKYTGAREGDRTVMDVLLPFAASFEKGQDFGSAVKVAAEKAEATKFLKPKFGRASYVGEDSQEQQLPDPGAWALFEMLSGMYKAMD